MSSPTEKDTTEKSAAEKTVEKKSTAKKSNTTKKTAAKKSSTKKRATKKSTAKKKDATKKASTKKPAAKKRAVKKDKPAKDTLDLKEAVSKLDEAVSTAPEKPAPVKADKDVLGPGKATEKKKEDTPVPDKNISVQEESIKKQAKDTPVQEPEETGYSPEVILLYCQHSVSRDVKRIDSYKHPHGFKVRELILPCSSNAESGQLLKILEQGADGIQVIGCSGEACKFLNGSDKAEKRVNYVQQILEEIDLGPDRIGMSRGAGLSAEELLDLAKQRADAIRSLGPNPMREDDE